MEVARILVDSQPHQEALGRTPGRSKVEVNSDDIAVQHQMDHH